jgi:hypothetical protein
VVQVFVAPSFLARRREFVDLTTDEANPTQIVDVMPLILFFFKNDVSFKSESVFISSWIDPPGFVIIILSITVYSSSGRLEQAEVLSGFLHHFSSFLVCSTNNYE